MTKPPSLPEKEWFTLEEISKRWEIDPDTVRHWAKSDILRMRFRIDRTPNPTGKIFPTCAVITRDERDRFETEYNIGPHAKKLPNALMDQRERRALLNIIGAMLELIKSPKPGRETNNGVITELLANYSDKFGISDRTLRAKFAEATRSLSEDD